ncbi:PP2C family protein-serine/threonine phosphatase [Planctomycetota bacterium]
MEIPLLSNRPRIPRTFTDVIYLSNRSHMPYEIRRLVRQKKLSHAILPFHCFDELRQRVHLVGNAIIDATDVDSMEKQEIGRIIQALELENIGVIVLTHSVSKPIRSFSLSPTKSSFSMAGTTDSISINDLWIRISVNLAYRKKSSGISSKPLIPASKMERPGTNRLAEQLKMAGSLIETLTEELRLAGQVQRDFLPHTLPNTDQIQWAATFMPAEWVSGDIYNVTALDDDHVGFYIVDAVGHAMPAALLTIFVKQAMQLTETVDKESRILRPAEVMHRLNLRMSREKLSGYQFATACYCLLNTRTLELAYARAGHPYPLLIREGETPEQLEVRGSLLGVFEEAQYGENTVQLEPGDKFILYSDGAEPFMGEIDEKSHFTFFEGFNTITSCPIMEMMDRFASITKSEDIDPGAIDDITLVGLQIQEA